MHKDKKGVAKDSNLIITTIQKLNTAISKPRYLKDMQGLKDANIVFIFDECHRSQFGEAHKNITNFFSKARLIGFTGTPIFAKNTVSGKYGKKTTTDLFDEILHKYVITDAISDDNVLKFSVEYVGRYKQKQDSATAVDIEVEDINTKELLESPARIDKIVDYIIMHHNKITRAREFTAIMCVSSIDVLCKYYESFKSKDHNLKIATIFSYSANEDDKDANGIYELDETNGAYIDDRHINKHSREKLDEYIEDYNNMFGDRFSTKDAQGFYNYYNDISKKVKNKKVDILLVVNMFLTGFDSPMLNTLYVDKNLIYHNLIQAYSRTNRIVNERKSHGNIVCFRNLKKNTDDAIALFSNKDAKDIILMQSYDDYVISFNEDVEALKAVVSTVNNVDDLIDEEDQARFIVAFRALIRTKNILDGFSDFKWSNLDITEQEFEDFTSKYLDIKDARSSKSKVDKASVLDDLDYEVDLICKDVINVAYILKLLAKLVEITTPEEKIKQRANITNIINANPQLRSKKELIEDFIDTELDGISADDIDDKYGNFVEAEKEKALDKFIETEKLKKTELNNVIDTYLYDGRKPLNDEIVKTLKTKPKLLEREKVTSRIKQYIMSFIKKFYD